MAAVGLPAARRQTVLAVLATAALALPATVLAHEAGADRAAGAAAAAADSIDARLNVASFEAMTTRGVATPLFEQHSRRGGSGSGGGGGQAVPRGGSGAPAGGSGSGGGDRGGSGGGSRGSGGGDRGGSGGTVSPRSGSEPGSTSGTGSRGGARTRGTTGDSTADGTDTPTYSRPRGDRPATGTAVERRRGDGTTVIIARGGYYGGLYPWGWGGIGLGGYYGYYDPWGWYDPYPPAIYATDGYDGALKIKVKPRDAEVYVDGYFAGEVDDYDGVFQKLRLEPGPHRIEIRLEGYEPLTFEVRIQPDRTVTYRGELKKTDDAD